jgi:hypothetical protein
LSFLQLKCDIFSLNEIGVEEAAFPRSFFIPEDKDGTVWSEEEIYLFAVGC